MNGSLGQLLDFEPELYCTFGNNHFFCIEGPVYEIGHLEHSFQGGQILLPPSTNSTNLHGPKYQIDNKHHFSEIIMHAEHLKELQGPVYDLEETKHHFREMTKHVESLVPLSKPIFTNERHSYGERSQPVEGLKEVHGPVYVKENVRHNYSEQSKSAELQTASLQGPIYYMNDDYKHHYDAIQEHVHSLKTLKGPVYDVEGKNHYSEIIKHVQSLQTLIGKKWLGYYVVFHA